jgi:CubicO group peptidase (beta-lactamase class C family)
MKRITDRKYWLLSTGLLVAAAALAQNKKAEFDKYFQSLFKNGQFNGNVLIAEKGKVIYEKSFGYADFSVKKLNTKQTSFPIASLSKTITATAILQLAQAKKLSVADAVMKYLPQFPYSNITIQHLLSHTSGLPAYNAYFDSTRKLHPDTVFTNADFLHGLTTNTRSLIYQPGEKGNYDNINFVVLALVIEKVTGMLYNNYITQYVLRPAGMTHTMFIPLRVQYTQPVNLSFAYPYLYPHKYSDSLVKAKEVPFITKYWSTYNFSGFSDYVSTVYDLLSYDNAYYNGTLLKQATINEAFEPVKLNNGKNNPGNFGWGWEVDKDSSFGKVVYHNGNATGHSCILVRNISKHQTIILFDNIHNNNSQALAFKLLKMLNGIEVPLPKKSIASEYARILLREGPKAARDKLIQLKADTTNYQLSEDEMNTIGYDFMGGSNNPNPYRFPEEHKYQEALETLKLNTELFPNSWNCYDSYGEILLKLGKKAEAVKMYQKSIELNPKNEGGKKVLEQIMRENNK